ncbi:MAG: glycosyltransferase family 2 protein [Calditrichaeota bacterium]|nr:glycosyltransferase family 2 protein [Calditrichota bacterium]
MSTGNETPRILAIVPALNEERNVGRVVAQLRAHPRAIDVLVVDDGSTDNTAAVARAQGARVISLPFNLGIGGAVQTGFKYAQRHGYDIAVQVDGDGQHDVREIDKLLEPVLSGEADVVIGSRYKGAVTYRAPFMRRVGMVIFALVNSLIIRQRVADNTSGFRAFNRRAILFLARDYPADYPEPEAVVLLGRSGFRLMEVAVNMNQRLHGRSSIDSFQAMYFMIKVLLAVVVDLFRYSPQRGEQVP